MTDVDGVGGGVMLRRAKEEGEPNLAFPICTYSTYAYIIGRLSRPSPTVVSKARPRSESSRYVYSRQTFA